MMEELLYIQKYYHYLIVFLLFNIILSFHSYYRKNQWIIAQNIITILFATYTVYYLGARSTSVGIDTYNYKYAFQIYQDSKAFEIRKDPFYDLLTYLFSRFFEFQFFLTFCAGIYVFGIMYGLKKIFRSQYHLPFLIFLISPYFFQFGINVMRSGMAASLFLIGIGCYYQKRKLTTILFWVILSMLFHLSMLLPLTVFLVSKYTKSTKIIFLVWLSAIILGLGKINFLSSVIDIIDFIAIRFSEYTTNDAEYSYWSNFIIFGATPVLLAFAYINYLGYKDKFYIRLLNIYMISHIPYILLINSKFALRLAYLSEFMMPVLLLYPLVVNPVFKIKFIRVYLTIAICGLFLFKAYKILIV